MEAFQAERIRMSYTYAVDAHPSVIFPLLCPVREYEWIDGWTCDMVYSVLGFAEKGCIFRTNFPHEGEETWIVSRYEQDCCIEFVRTTPDASRLTLLEIVLQENSGTTEITWTRIITGLNPSGNAFVVNKTVEIFDFEMGYLEKMLKYYLATGVMLRLPENEKMELSQGK